MVPALLTRGLRVAMQEARKVEARAEVLEAQWSLDDVWRDGRRAGNGMGVSEGHVSVY